MSNPDIDKRAERIRYNIELLERWRKNVGDDESIAVQLISTHYLVVDAYGMIESLMKHKIIKYINENCPENFVEVLTKNVSSRYNWGFSQVKEVMGEYNKKWLDDLGQKLTNQQKYAITTLRNNRNKIAHGSSSDATFHESKKQFENAVESLQIIYQIIDG